MKQARHDGSGFFVTGTDTNIGKTVLSALLCGALVARYWKPIQTGAVEGTDREKVMEWTGMTVSEVAPEAYIFDDPVSPHLAARRAVKRIVLEKIVPPAFGPDAPLVVEGAGGVLVPINASQFMTDLMQHVGLPAILAARSTLGTINHTLLSLLALREAKIPVHGVVPIGPPDRDNEKAIERYGGVRILGRIPILQRIHRQALAEVFAAHFDRSAFL